MADPSEVQAIWQRAITTFPDFKGRWGDAVPQDPRILNAALNDYRNLLTKGVAEEPYSSAIVDTEQYPKYSSSDFWKGVRETGKDFLSPLATTLTAGQYKPDAQKQFRETLDEQGLMAAYGVSGAPFDVLDTISDVVSPMAGELTKGRPEISKKVEDLQNQGYNRIDALAQAYRQARDEGEIPWQSQVAAEGITELGIGGIGRGVSSVIRGLRGTVPDIATATAPRVAAQQIDVPEVPIVPEGPPRVSWSPPEPIRPEFADMFKGTTAPTRVTGTQAPLMDDAFMPMQRALPVEETPEGTLRAIPQEELRQMDQGQLRMGETVPWQQQPTAIEDFVRTPGTQLDLPLRSPMQGQRLPDISAEDLLARQADEAKWEWQPGQPIGRQTTPSGKRRTWKIGDVTKAQQRSVPDVYQPRLPIGEDIQNIIPSIDQVPPSVQPVIDKLIAYRQTGVDLSNPGYKRWTTQWMNEAANALFGDTSTSSIAKVKEYIDSFPGQQELPFESFGEMEMALNGGGNIWIDWLENFYLFDPATNSYKLRPDRPLPVTSKGWKGVDAELEAEEFINSRVPTRSKEISFTGVSSWVKNLPLIEGHIIDSVRKNWKEFATPDELNSLEGIFGYFKRGVAAPIKTLTRRYGGNIDAHDKYMEKVSREGTAELQELGWLDNNGAVIDEALGTWDAPGPIRILFNALHDKTWLPKLEALGPSAMRQYYNLRNLTDMEEVLRGEHPGLKLKLKDFNLGEDADQYFYRGVIPESLNLKEFSENLNKLGRTKSIEMHRINKSWVEMQEIGLRPIYWNPYQQAMYSSRIGVHSRLQQSLLEILKDPNLNMAAEVGKNTAKHGELYEQGWRPIRNAGPALKEGKIWAVPEKFVNAIDPEDHLEEIDSEWLFPAEVANALNDVFGQQGTFLQFMRQPRFRALDHDWKIDDLIFIPKRIDLFGSVFQQVDFAQRSVLGGFSTSLDVLLENMKLMGRDGNISDPDAWKKLFQSFNHTFKTTYAIRDMTRAFFSKNYRTHLKDMMLDDSDWFPTHPKLKGKFSNFKLFQNGLHINDVTIFGSADDQVRILDDVVEELGWNKNMPTHMAEAVRSLENWFREGLFDGVYPAAIMHDVRHNIIPLAMRLNPDMNADQIMGLSSKRANKIYSTIPKEQSTFKGTFRDVLKRILFSLGEQEAFGRQFTSMFRGEDKRFYATRNIGSLLGLALIGNTIHFATTGEPLPLKRYMPFQYTGWNLLKYRYNPQYLSPDTPFPTRLGDKATLDLMMQYDFIFRILDAGHGLPIIGGLSSRLGTVPRWIATQISGKNFRGEDIGRWGYLQRAIQGINDLITPIGLEHIANALIIKSMGDKRVPAIGTSKLPIVIEGATVSDLIPTGERGIDSKTLALQGLTGLNLKSTPANVLRDTMVENVFGEGLHPQFDGIKHTTWDGMMKDTENNTEMRQIVWNDARNVAIVKEMNIRQEEGRTQYMDDDSRAIMEIKDSNKEKYRAEIQMVEELGMALFNPKPVGHSEHIIWSPDTWNTRRKKINSDHNQRVAGIESAYKFDPLTKLKMDERSEMPKRSEEPLDWALWNYYDIRDKHTNLAGQIDYTAFENEWNLFVSEWDDDERKETGGLEERFDAWMMGIPGTNSFDDHHPLVQQQLTELGELDKAGYWKDGPEVTFANGQKTYVQTDPFFIKLQHLDSTHRVALSAKGQTSFSVWDEYLGANKETRRAMESSASFAVQSIVKNMKSTVADNRVMILRTNPTLDRYVIKWFGNTPSVYSNREYYRQLYGSYPSSTRKLSVFK